MPGNAALRAEDPLDGLRTVHLIEDAIVQRGLRQLRTLLTDTEGRRVVDEILMGAVGSLGELDEIVAQWERKKTGAPAPEAPAVDREDVLRSFIDLKESEALVLRRAARDAPPEFQGRLTKLADQADAHAQKLRDLR